MALQRWPPAEKPSPRWRRPRPNQRRRRATAPAAIGYITDNNPVVFDNMTSGAEAHINGPLLDLPAGPLSGALGGDPAAIPFQTSNFNHVSTADYFDFQETYHLNPNTNIYLNIQNAFNLPPQFSFSNSNYAQTTNEALYDQVGRMFRVGIRLKY